MAIVRARFLRYSPVMRHFAFGSVLLACVLWLGLGCDPGGPPPSRDGSPGDAGVAASDADGDTISDADEGARDGVDTDGDGMPDFEDLDSDNDGIADAVEAGDADLGTAPVDSDSDGTPDYRDLDSDGNSINDADELEGDVDMDGTPNFADLDDDNDLLGDVLELAGVLTPPADFDGDGLADFQDLDSDNDNIADTHEQDIDNDGDGVKDRFDLDTDDDGILDIDEAGDTDPRTPPVDSDGDLVPDFRDLDSDNDGLSDADEVTTYMTNPTLEDSDGDGVSDLIEVGAGTNPNDINDNPMALGDFVFVVPFEQDPMPPRDTLQFRTNLAFLDVYFLFDVSGSMAGEIGALRTAVNSIIGNLQCMDTGTACGVDADCAGFAGGTEVCSPFTNTCIENPAMSSCVLSPWTGVGQYEDQYCHGAGPGTCASGVTNAAIPPGLRLQPDPMATASTMANWRTHGGTEELYQALWGVADPSAPNAVGCETLGAGEVGCPAFREQAVKIVIAFTDEDSDGTETVTQAANALMAANIRMIGVWSGTAGSAARNELRDVVLMSGSLDRAGNPLFYEGVDGGVVTPVTNAINEIVEGVPIEVTIDAVDQPGDAGDSLVFIDRLETNTSGMGGCTMAMTADANPAGDGVQDTFPSVSPGTPVCFDVVARRNDCVMGGPCVMPLTTPQVFEAQLTVYGGGSPVDQRRVFFLVPPVIEGPGGPD